MQEVDGKRHPCRYESGIWKEAERRYDAGKRECRGLLKALKKLRVYLYGVRFTVETDANTLVHQLNLPASDLPGAVITRWIAWLRLFDFDVVHVSGEKNSGPDALSRRPRSSDDSDDDEPEDDIEQMIEADMYAVWARAVRVAAAEATELAEEGPFGERGYPWAEIIEYLSNLRRPETMTSAEFRKFKNTATKFLLQKGHLYRRRCASEPPAKVIFMKEERLEILKALHDEGGHRGREGTFRKLAERYWWPRMYDHVRDYVKTCKECQLRARRRYEEPLRTVTVSAIWRRVGLDAVHMPMDEDGHRSLVVAREYLTGWVEARALKELTTENVATFVLEDIICRFGVPRELMVDGGSENKGELIRLADVMGIYRCQVMPYHPESNRLIERGHKQITDALSKLTECSDQPEWRWKEHLPAVLWADRTTAKRTTGYTPYRLMFGTDCVLPVELS
jgi:hypothetical protein